MSVPAQQMIVADQDPAAALQPSEGGVVPYQVSEERVRRLWEDYDLAREFDDVARADYAFCRRYARGDAHWEVAVNLLGTYIDILTAFLYARNPDAQCMPAASVGKKRLKEAKEFADTMQAMLGHNWKASKLKRAAKRWVRSSLTNGIGWLKSGWQELYQQDPQITQRKRDIQENLAKIEAMQKELADGTAEDIEARREELEAMMDGLKGESERLVYRGIFVDFVPSENIQVSLDVQNVVDCMDASWIAHLNYITLDEAKAKYPELTDEDWSTAEQFYVNKPVKRTERSKTAAMEQDISPQEATPFGSGTSNIDSKIGRVDARNKFVMVLEMWRGDENLVYDLVRGVKKCAGCAPPNAPTTRFYPFFPLAMHEVDGERHPQSLVMRSFKLMDEYNRTRSGKAELRRRIKPKMFFDARAHTPQQITKIVNGTYGEHIPLKPAVDGATLQQSIWESPYPKIDPALFDLSEVRQELETMWGIQEALAGGIQVAKTATEAEIQQAGTSARTGSMRDTEEDVLSELANYHAEILITKCSLQDAQEIAGDGAVWPQIGIDDIDLLLSVEIAAGTTGKPNTTAQREAWAAEMPIIRELMEKIALLRQSGPMEMADAYEELLRETFVRAGDDRVDVDRFLPPAGAPVELMDPVTGAPVLAYPAPMAAPGEGGMAPGGAPGPMPGATPEQALGDAVAPTDLPAALA